MSDGIEKFSLTISWLVEMSVKTAHNRMATEHKVELIFYCLLIRAEPADSPAPLLEAEPVDDIGLSLFAVSVH